MSEPEWTTAKIDEALTQNVLDGMIEVAGMDEEGNLTFRLTEAGEQRARGLIADMGIDPDKLKDMSPEDFRKAIGPPDA